MKRIQLFILLTSLVYITGCSSNDDGLIPEFDPANEQIKFEIGFADSNSPKTRISYRTDILAASWKNGDKIGIYIVKGDGALQPSGNYADNLEFTYNYYSGKWTTDNPLYYPNDGEKLSFYAYYPFNPDMTNPTAYNFSLPTDQSVQYSIETNDFMWAKQENVAKSNQGVSLLFSHALVLIKVDIQHPKANYLIPDIPIDLTGVSTNCTINLSTQNVTCHSTKNNIRTSQKHFTAENIFFQYTNWVLVPPQTTDVKFSWLWKGTNYVMTPETNATLISGRVYKYFKPYS